MGINVRDPVGSGRTFSSVFYVGTFDGQPGTDVIAPAVGGSLFLYPGNGTGRWSLVRKIDSGWQFMTRMGQIC